MQERMSEIQNNIILDLCTTYKHTKRVKSEARKRKIFSSLLNLVAALTFRRA